jgi:cysteine desulfurase/selenocysteine lyase
MTGADSLGEWDDAAVDVLVEQVRGSVGSPFDGPGPARAAAHQAPAASVRPPTGTGSPDDLASLAAELSRSLGVRVDPPDALPPGLFAPEARVAPPSRPTDDGTQAYFLASAPRPTAHVPDLGVRQAEVPTAAAVPVAMPAPPAVPAASAGPLGAGASVRDALALRAQFPALQQEVNGRRLVWLDNGATTHKPQQVIDVVRHYYERDNSNVHRSAHTLAVRSTDAMDRARATVARFLGTPRADEVVFVRGTTEAINLVAQSWGRANLGPGDEVLVSWLEHHANIVPWQFATRAAGATLRPIPVTDAGDIDLAAYHRMLGPQTKLVALTHVSNVVGTVLPIEEMAAAARRHGALVLVDGAQSVAHMPVDVGALGADFFAFSGHKVFGPTGIGVLWARREILEAMPPWQGGGAMITDVTFERSTFNPPPVKFEAGTPHIAGIVGLGAALEWLDSLGRPIVAAAEHALLEYAEARLRQVPKVRVLGRPTVRAGAIPLVVEGVAPDEVARFLDTRGIAVRAGHHCAQPTVRRLGFEAVVRPSFAVYNCPDDVDALVAALGELSRS